LCKRLHSACSALRGVHTTPARYPSNFNPLRPAARRHVSCEEGRALANAATLKETLMNRFALTLAAALIAGPALAEDIVTAASADAEVPAMRDPLIAPDGHIAASVATGLPYLAIGEVAYGVTSRFTAGVIAGVTPNTEGFGVRLRGVLIDGDADRLIAASPILFYPATQNQGNEPWFLVMPELLAEHRFANGARVHAGFGVAAATCTDTLEAFFTGKRDTDHSAFMGDLWATAKIGGSVALGHSTMLFADVTLVTPGLILGHAWIVGIPLVATVGVEHAF
jgi:hypothetical protein